MNTELATQQMKTQIANAYRELRDEIDKADTGQMERLLQENEYARIIFVRDSLIQRMRFLAADYFQEKSGSAAKALKLSERLMEANWKPDIRRIDYSGILPIAGPIELRPEKGKAGWNFINLEGSTRLKHTSKIVHAVKGAVTALPAWFRSWSAVITGAGTPEKESPVKKDRKRAFSLYQAQGGDLSLDDAVARLLKEREYEVTDILGRMIFDMERKIEKLSAEGRTPYM